MATGKIVAMVTLALLFASCKQLSKHEPWHKHDLHGEVHVHTPPFQQVYEFHGHLGPYVVLGFRAARLARRLLKSPGYFDLEAEVLCPLNRPKSCFIDGIQLGSGCTLGKRNIQLKEASQIECVFTTQKGESARIALKEEMPGKIATWIEETGVEETGEKVMELPHKQVFTVKAPR